jgi:alanine-synthesizing transaminase
VARFSSRIPSDPRPNRLHEALQRLRAAGRPLIDLTLSNPTIAGIEYPPDLLAPLAHRDGLRYDPSPFGIESARVAAARAHGGVPADRIILTASTSEAYSILFKLLCDPGDEVLVPRPSYPLFEFLTTLDGVKPIPYPVEFHGGWFIDLSGVEAAISSRTRAILIVNPNNPTGSYLKRAEREALAAIARARDIALIGDEVFYNFPIAGAPPAAAVRVTDQGGVLAFALGGLSKTVGLPQLKLGWMAVAGPDALVAEALARLEIICDTYLSVATPVQLAASSLLAGGAAVRARIRDRVRGNHTALAREAARHPSVQVLPVEGGWYAVLRVPALRSEEDLALELLESDGVIAHPGYFFDFPHEAFLVVSLLPPPELFTEGVRRTLARAGADVAV